MSEPEYAYLTAGAPLSNYCNHRRDHGKLTDAIGFCFFSKDPEKAIHWLRGVVCTDVLVTFDVPDGFMQEAKAEYRDARYEPGFRHPHAIHTDYYCTKYSARDLTILATTRKYRMDGPARAILYNVCSSYWLNGLPV